MVIADACESNGIVVRAPTRKARRRIYGELFKGFECFSHLHAGEAVKAVAALPFHRDHFRLHQLREMATCCVRRNSGDVRKLRRRQNAVILQRSKHVGPRWISDERGDFGNVWSVEHYSTVAESSSPRNQVFCEVHSPASADAGWKHVRLARAAFKLCNSHRREGRPDCLLRADGTQTLAAAKGAR